MILSPDFLVFNSLGFRTFTSIIFVKEGRKEKSPKLFSWKDFSNICHRKCVKQTRAAASCVCIHRATRHGQNPRSRSFLGSVCSRDYLYLIKKNGFQLNPNPTKRERGTKLGPSWQTRPLSRAGAGSGWGAEHLGARRWFRRQLPAEIAQQLFHGGAQRSKSY